MIVDIDEDIHLDNVILEKRRELLEDKKITVNGPLSNAFTKALAIAFTKTIEEVDEKRSDFGDDLTDNAERYVTSVEDYNPDLIKNVPVEIVKQILASGKPTNIYLRKQEDLVNPLLYSAEADTLNILILLLNGSTEDFNRLEVETRDNIKQLCIAGFTIYRVVPMN